MAEVRKDKRHIVRLNFFEEKVDDRIKKGVIVIDNEIDMSSMASFFEEVIVAHSVLPPGKPIWVVINSQGGHIDQGLGMYDLIKAIDLSGREINTVGLGLIASMATCVLQAGTRRYSLPNTQFLVHQARQFTPYDVEEVTQGEERIEELKRVNRLMFGIISNRIGMDVNKIIELAKKRDHWMDAKDARKLGTEGLIDEIITTLPFLGVLSGE